MPTNTYIIIGIIIAVVVGGFFFFQNQGTPEAPEQQTQQPSSNEVSAPGGGGEPSSVRIAYTDDGYSPKEVTIAAGDTITFVNESSRLMWPATAIHPTHTIYPGSNIQKCATPEAEGMFDACEEIASGAEWSFQFNEVGSWGYHDHRQPRHTGKIIVE